MRTVLSIPCIRTLCAVFFCCLFSCSHSEADSSGKPSGDTPAPEAKGTLRLMIAAANQGPNIEDTLDSRCDAALNLMASETPEIKYIPFTERNQTLLDLEKQGIEPTAATMAKKLNIDRLLFISVMRLGNMLRVGLTATMPPDYRQGVNGSGYALLRYHDEKTDKRIYDAAVLEALQRAIADAFQKPQLFANAKTFAPALPAPVVVTTGIQFDDQKIKPTWSLFKNKTVNSYEMVLNIFDAIKDSPKYVAYDIDSRDTMYAIQRLIMPENYQAPTPQELMTLEKFEVPYIISGTFIRTSPEEAELTLMLGTLKRGTYTEQARRSTKITSDSHDQLIPAVQNLARELVK